MRFGLLRQPGIPPNTGLETKKGMLLRVACLWRTLTVYTKQPCPTTIKYLATSVVNLVIGAL